jgi:sulfur carrier protein ThiS
METKQIEIHVHADDGNDPKRITLAEDATVEDLLRIIQAETGAIAELEGEILLLVEDREALVRREHKLCDHGIRHGHHVHVSKAKHIYVAVVTTSGTWPHKGFASVPIHQAVKIQLQHAAKRLGITDMSNWVAKVKGRELNVEKNYTENGLHHKVDIDYGPREGGGGCNE